MFRNSSLILISCVLAMALGCAANQGQPAMEHQARRMQLERDNYKRRYEDERAKATLLAQHYDAATHDRDLTKAEVNTLKSRLASLETANREYQELIEKQGNRKLERPELVSARLPEAIDQALADFAAKFADLVTYDSGRGAVKFSNDLLFQSASDVLRPTARAGLEASAKIAAAPQAADYEVIVVGHTDAAPITKPETKKRHPSNRHLSAHRAIAVAEVLAKAGVPQANLAIMGYGPHRPISSDHAQNRRVEIFLSRKGEVKPLGGG